MDEKNENKDHNALDSEFRQMLRMIKPYIPCIINNDYMLSYRLWLEKLNESDSSQKFERNKYLFELCRQIQDGVLKQPFDKLPSPGPLLPFQAYDQESCHEIENTGNTPKLKVNKCGNVADTPPESNNFAVQNLQCKHQHCNETCKAKLSEAPNNYFNPPHELQIVDEDLQQTPEKGQTDQSPKASKNRTIFSKHDHLKCKREDETSWCDLSEFSPSVLESKLETESSEDVSSTVIHPKHENNIYENKIQELTNFITMLQTQNLELNENIVKYEEELRTNNKSAETAMCNLSNEIEYLKHKIKELQCVKTTLKKNQAAVSQQLQLTINNFQKRIQFAENQNYQLKTEISSFEKRLESLNAQKHQEINELKENLLVMQNKEVEMLKESHYNQLTNVENHFNKLLITKEREFLLEISCLKSSHDVKLADISQEYKGVVINRNQEIQRLEKMIETQCKKVQKEVKDIKNKIEETAYVDNKNSGEKVDFLQQSINKLNKLFKKSEKQCTLQMNRLKEEIGVSDKSLQLHLKAQKPKTFNHSSSNNNSNNMRHQETDDLLNQLEDRYKKLLENQQKYFFAERQRDSKVIEELKEIIGKTYCDFDQQLS